MLKKISLLAMILITCLTGCGKNNENENDIIWEIFDDFKIVLIVADERLGFYQDALTSIEKYLNNPMDELLSDAVSQCESSIKLLLESKPVSSSLSYNAKNKMTELGIDLIDYNTMFNTQQTYIDEYLEGLAGMMFYLEKADDLQEQIRYNYTIRNDFNQAKRRLLYIGVNHLFASISGGELDDFKDYFLPELKYFSVDALPWETDKKILEAKAERCLLDMETALGNYAIDIGYDYAEVLQMERTVKDSYTELGYGEDEIKEILDDIYLQSENLNQYVQRLLNILGQ